ncbi:MAG TPA: hypothetical protein VGN49_14275 [Micrococcaceae bacterium]|jgi:hypothetical protein|nr:hypothetical protein [Micrococcaceae bacterium]
MADKSPRQSATKKSGKSIKEKRADKRATEATATSMEKPASTKKK